MLIQTLTTVAHCLLISWVELAKPKVEPAVEHLSHSMISFGEFSLFWKENWRILFNMCLFCKILLFCKHLPILENENNEKKNGSQLFLNPRKKVSKEF